MIPTHTMRIPVRAWQVGPDGSLPEEAVRALNDRGTEPRRVQYERSEREVAAMREVGWELSTHADYWYWFSCEGNQRASAGMWVACHEYGCEAMRDAEFQERCEEVPDAS